MILNDYLDAGLTFYSQANAFSSFMVLAVADVQPVFAVALLEP
jgi:hypothetical protein